MKPGAPIILCPLDFERKRLLAAGFPADCRVETCGPGREGVNRWAGANRRLAGPVLLVGLAGALVDRYEIGDVVIADAVLAAGGKRIETTWSIDDPGARRGAITSTTRSVTSRPAKGSLRAVTGATIVDQESQAFAEAGRELGWRFGIVRGIGDTLDNPLPPGCDKWVDHHGRALLTQVAASLLREPSLLGRMRQIKRSGELAMDNLAEVLERLVKGMTDG